MTVSLFKPQSQCSGPGTIIPDPVFQKVPVRHLDLVKFVELMVEIENNPISLEPVISVWMPYRYVPV
jgi:hypothetical protein